MELLVDCTHAPRISGTVLRDGAPVAGAQVLLSSRMSKKTAAAKTDADGRFSLGPLTELNLTRSVFGDPLYLYKLVIRVDGDRDYPGLEGREMGAAPADFQVACDLGRPSGQGASVRYCSR